MIQFSRISIFFILFSLVGITKPLKSVRPKETDKSKEFYKYIEVAQTAGYTRHNELRELHRCVPLVRDKKLEAKAQKYAEKLINWKKLKHSDEAKNDRGGESLFMITGKTFSKNSKDDFFKLGHVGVNEWYSEICLYNFDDPKFVFMAERFTQLIWNSTKKVGMGFSYDPKQKKYIVVANYKPPGNRRYTVSFETNVACPVSLSLVEKICKPDSEAGMSASCKATNGTVKPPFHRWKRKISAGCRTELTINVIWLLSILSVTT